MPTACACALRPAAAAPACCDWRRERRRAIPVRNRAARPLHVRTSQSSRVAFGIRVQFQSPSSLRFLHESDCAPMGLRQQYRTSRAYAGLSRNPADFASADVFLFDLGWSMRTAPPDLSGRRRAWSVRRESERSDMPGAVGHHHDRNDDENLAHLIDSRFLRAERHQDDQKGEYLHVKAQSELREAVARTTTAPDPCRTPPRAATAAGSLCGSWASGRAERRDW